MAPVMLENYALFFTGMEKIHCLSKYMLLNFRILPEYRDLLAGAIHFDGSARIQTIFNRNENPFLHDLLHEMDSS
jgi:carbamoyltransferase